MAWLGSLYRSSIGKKSIMAASGLLLCLFLLAHLMGNAASFLGRDALNAYAEKLHSLGALIYKARPSRYAVNTSAGGRTIGSRFMPYTGAIMTVFIVVHLMNFHFTDKSIPVADLVRSVLSRPGPALFYIVSLLAVALHLSHGAWSLFQSIGFNHEKYNNVLYRGALAFSILVGGVFILIPFLALVSRGFLL
jgi:succinate dehydrogenase / fumarate reductase cytochrome b subunit